mmetsp:Transcript_44261/g.71152  ORF Transcript_44261/g.71152 Transcript_44261/m.71152 type:complete len:912 (+) Transcript_44261:529-3264(+)
MVYCWIYPSSTFFKALFVVSNGPLAWSVVVFDNSLVFHDWEKVFSVFIHINPALFTYSLRWHCGEGFFSDAVEGEYSSFSSVSRALKYIYIPWCIGYYTWVFLVLAKRAREKRLMTLYEYMTDAGGFGFFKKISAISLVNKAIYVLFHLVAGTVTMVMASLLWYDRIAHSAFLVSILCAACWNSAEHYFEDFSKKYEDDVTARLGKAGYNVKKEVVNTALIPKDIMAAAAKKVAEISGFKGVVSPKHNLMFDLGMTSISIPELIGWMQDTYNCEEVEPADLSTVEMVAWAIFTKRPKEGEMAQIKIPDAPKGWLPPHDRPAPQLPKGELLPLAFWNNAMRMKNHIAIGDDTTGPMTYSRMQTAVVLLADYINAHPEMFEGKNIGLMLPATSGVAIMAFSLMMAGKVPVMINWTHGSKNLRHVIKTANIKCVLTAKKFTKRIASTVDLKVFQDGEGSNLMVFYEDIKTQLYYTDMIKAALFTSKLNTEQIKARYSLDEVKASDPCVILYTSGSESAPKGVPLSHTNVLSNIGGIVEMLLRSKPKKPDILMGCLPPFHSFGWTATTCCPLTTGIQVAYYVSPTDSKRLVFQVAKWKATIYLGTPRFLSGLLAAAGKERKLLESVRLCVTGAEKLPDIVVKKAAQVGIRDGVVEGYGITETSPVLTCNLPGQPNQGVGEPVKTAPETSIAIVIEGKSGEYIEAGKGEKGLIIARGPGVFSGYLKGTTNKIPFVEYKDSKDWYDTGDLGRMEGGKLYLMGRQKRFVKVAGEMVSLPMLEKVLQKKWGPNNEGKMTVAVEGFEATELEKTFIGILATPDADMKDLKAAQTHLRENGVNGVQLPNLLIRVKEIPLLATGKAALGSMKWLVKYKAGTLAKEEIQEDASLKDESNARFLTEDEKKSQTYLEEWHNKGMY